MKIGVPTFLKRLWHVRNENGDDFYSMTAFNGWSDAEFNLAFALNHPILTPAMLFMSKLFSQAKFFIRDKRTNEKIYKHEILDLLNNPNIYMSSSDLLASTMFLQITEGTAVWQLKRGVGISTPDSIYVLRYSLITFPEGFITKNIYKKNRKDIENTYIIYDKDGPEKQKIKIKDLIFIHDIPPTGKNKFQGTSRLQGLKQTLINTQDSLIAKNIILKTNGKELITGNNKDFPMTPDEKRQAQESLNNNYGLGFNRSRGLVTKASVTWKSMHIALRDLGLDESVKVDGNIIYTALHIPKDIISLEAKKTTYNNFKESMVSYVQNIMQPAISDVANTVNASLFLNSNYELGADYDDLPIMQFILIEKFDGVLKRALALTQLRKAGLPDKEALHLVGLKTNIKLNDYEKGGKINEEDNNEEEETKSEATEKWLLN